MYTWRLDPAQTMRAVTDVVTTFQTPGMGIDGFARKTVIIANEGIYDLRLHLDDVLMPTLRQWSVFDKTGLGAEGERPARSWPRSWPRPRRRPPGSSSAGRSAGHAPRRHADPSGGPRPARARIGL
jgi:hypothetical protein